jgi:hypothetical protein
MKTSRETQKYDESSRDSASLTVLARTNSSLPDRQFPRQHTELNSTWLLCFLHGVDGSRRFSMDLLWSRWFSLLLHPNRWSGVATLQGSSSQSLFTSEGTSSRDLERDFWRHGYWTRP